jgi:hypothetical protein
VAIDDVQVYNNTLKPAPGAGALVVPWPSFVGAGPRFFRNNLVSGASFDVRGWIQGSGLVLDHNLYWSRTSSTSGYGEPGSVAADPGLNPDGGLTAGSPAHAAGADVCAGTDDACSMGGRDYFGNTVGTAGRHSIGADDSTSG